MHGRHIEDWESLKSIFLDEHHTVNVIGRKVLKGAFLGWTYGWIARNFFWRGPKSFELDRLWMLNKYLFNYPEAHPDSPHSEDTPLLELSWEQFGGQSKTTSAYLMVKIPTETM